MKHEKKSSLKKWSISLVYKNKSSEDFEKKNAKLALGWNFLYQVNVGGFY